MTSKDNSVNIEKSEGGKSKSKYHHGDLRAALIAVGLELIKESAADQLSLREVARQAGVSATAVYRHFPDKQALLYALCGEGAVEMAAKLKKAEEEAGGGYDGFVAVGRAYIYFALGNPGLYRVMMSTRPPEGFFMQEGHVANGAMQILQDNVEALLGPETGEFKRKVTALHAWSMVHGLSMLILDGLIPPDGDVIDAMLELPMNLEATPKI